MIMVERKKRKKHLKIETEKFEQKLMSELNFNWKSL